jgi:hypothetical protein
MTRASVRVFVVASDVARTLKRVIVVYALQNAGAGRSNIGVFMPVPGHNGCARHDVDILPISQPPTYPYPTREVAMPITPSSSCPVDPSPRSQLAPPCGRCVGVGRSR